MELSCALPVAQEWIYICWEGDVVSRRGVSWAIIWHSYTEHSVKKAVTLRVRPMYSLVLLIDWLFDWVSEWMFYAHSPCKAIFRARTYSHNVFILVISMNNTWWKILGGNLPPEHDALLFWASRTDTAGHTKAFDWNAIIQWRRFLVMSGGGEMHSRRRGWECPLLSGTDIISLVNYIISMWIKHSFNTTGKNSIQKSRGGGDHPDKFQGAFPRDRRPSNHGPLGGKLRWGVFGARSTRTDDLSVHSVPH